MQYKWKSKFSQDIFKKKYAISPDDDWNHLAERVVDDVCGTRQGKELPLMSKSELQQLQQYITEMKFIPGGRYLYYAGRPLHFYNNCYCLKGEEDTREEWGSLLKRSSDALMSGGGIGVDYSIFRPRGKVLRRTGGISSGPIPLMCSVNEVGRNVMQGGSRRSAIFGSLNWQHEDIWDFIRAKDWPEVIRNLKESDFNFPAQLDMTNISIGWDDDLFKQQTVPSIWTESIRRMCKTGEPGHTYNFGINSNDTLRNACTEFTSEDDSDVCNLGSINIGSIESFDEFKSIVDLASRFLVCGTIRADLPYDKARQVREKNRKIGLGIMGIHEWLLRRNYPYEVVPELHLWLEEYKYGSERAAREHADRFSITHPKKFRALAPTGTIGILAGTTTGIEPLYAIAYKRRYLEGSRNWKYQYVIDNTAKYIIEETGVDPSKIDTALKLSSDVERRVKFQYDIQAYVDMGVSSTINLPSWGSKHNNEDTLNTISNIIFKYCHGLRGITVYPDGSRGGQPLTEVDYNVALKHKGTIFDEMEERCAGGVCGI